ncbi:MAG: MFS transporter [Candidatus Sphingomonas phytovorans]|nr:MFS transporter [Sphingomonas sp.]WEK02206.1 MAG: MFS transporter [Sphingomonas sp.]
MQTETGRPVRTMLLCLCAALIEGFDLQAAGVVAPGIRSDLGISAGQLALFFSAATIGLIFGALLGGRIADRFGRKVGLLVSLILFGICSVGAGMAHDFATLALFRFLTGIGLGGALPNLIAIAAESVARNRGMAVSVMFAGIPLGGALAGLFTLFGTHAHDGWRNIFIAGGLAPLLLVPMLAWALPPFFVRPSPEPSAEKDSAWRAVFGPGQLAATLLLWLAFFLSLLILYLILNWLPTLLIAQGFSPAQAGMVQLVFNLVGSIASIVVGRFMDGRHALTTIMIAYALLIIALIGLAHLPPNIALALGAGALLGSGLLGAQALLYGLSPQCYPIWARGTGVGASVAAGRFGSVAGPIFAGVMIAAGRPIAELLMLLVPLAFAAGAAAWLLASLLRSRRAHEDPRGEM